jgi:hypothetical protein
MTQATPEPVRTVVVGVAPVFCHRCGQATQPDPVRPGWRICPDCGPAYMPFGDGWIRVSVAAGAGQRTAQVLTGICARFPEGTF